VLRDIHLHGALGRRFGRYHRLAVSTAAEAVNKWALYQIARHCDEPVPDGSGGLEPRYTFNGVITTTAEAWQVLQTIAASFRGMLHWGAGRITATQDRPAEPVKLVTNANVLEGAFAYQGSALSARHTLAQVTVATRRMGFPRRSNGSRTRRG